MQKNIYCVESENAKIEFDSTADLLSRARKGANKIYRAGNKKLQEVQESRKAAAEESKERQERKQDFEKALDYANNQLDGADGALDDAIKIMNKRQEECYDVIIEAINKRIKDQTTTKATLRPELYNNTKIKNSILTEEKLINWVKQQNFFATE